MRIPCVALAVALAAVSFESLSTPIAGLVIDAVSSNALAGTRVTLFTITNSAPLLDWMPADTSRLFFRAKQEE